MARANANGIELEYETFGDAGKPVVVLVMGFSMQMIGWDDRFCEQLAGRGFCVVRFDNRDVGLSTKLDAMGVPDIGSVMGGDTSAAPYAIEDMADDVAGLTGAIGAPAVHVVGASMGGFIAQAFAIRHSKRVLSLASIMSTTGDRGVGRSSPEALGALMEPPPMDRESAQDRAVRVWRVIGSPGFPFDETRVRDLAARAWDRNHDFAGVVRQMAAIMTTQDRTPQLSKLRTPTVVIHGKDDPLIHVSGGEATARAIPGARLVVLPGMGHDLTPALWPTIIDAVVENARRAT